MDSFCQTWSPRLLSVLRIVTALMFLQHGTAKFFGFPHVAGFDNLQIFSLLGAASVLEIVGGVLLLIGLFTRPVAFILSGFMAVAYFMAHAPQALSAAEPGELAVLYCFIFLYLSVAGGGPERRTRRDALRVTGTNRSPPKAPCRSALRGFVELMRALIASQACKQRSGR
jgi:putative oxidoreductase